MNPIDTFLGALRAHDLQPRRSGEGWTCRCPAHEDHDPSLSINVGDDGRVLAHCHAGCDFSQVCAAVGLKPADVFPDNPHRRNGHAPAPRRRGDGDETPGTSASQRGFVASGSARRNRTEVFATQQDAIVELVRRHGPASKVWVYTDERNEPVGVTYRRDLPGGGKTVRHAWRTADASGWVLENFPAPHPLYRLPELRAALPGSTVWVCEGEKAADAACVVGLLATTSAGGSGRAKGTDWSPVAGHDIVILPDHDAGGEKYAADVTRLATAAGARSVRIARLAEIWNDIPEGGDMADFLEHHGGDAAVARAAVERLAESVKAEEPEYHDDDTLEFIPFPVEALPGPLARFVACAATSIGCDPSFIALPVLSVVASAIGGARRLELKPGWSEPSIVWGVIVGESGGHKTPALAAALKPLRDMQKKAMKVYEADRAEWDAQHQLYEAKLVGWKRDAGKGKPGDAYDRAPPERPRKPVARRYTTADPTVEALVIILSNNERGVLLERDELRGWIGSFDRYSKGGRGGGDVSHWLSMHSATPITVDRKGGDPPMIHVPAAVLSVTGGIQLGILARVIGTEHQEDGLLARLLLAMPPAKTKKWTDSCIEPAVEAEYARVVEALADITFDAGPDGDPRPRVLGFTTAARALWVEFYNAHAAQQSRLTGHEKSAWSKLEAYAARFALIVHLVRWASGDPTVTDPDRVDEASLRAAVTLTRWFGHEMLRVYGAMSESDEDARLRRLEEWVRAQGGATTARDVTRGPQAYRGDPDAAEADLGALVERGRGRWQHGTPGADGGRPTSRFVLAPRRDEEGGGDETPAEQARNRGFVAVATVPAPSLSSTDGTGGAA